MDESNIREGFDFDSDPRVKEIQDGLEKYIRVKTTQSKLTTISYELLSFNPGLYGRVASGKTLSSDERSNPLVSNYIELNQTYEKLKETEGIRPFESLYGVPRNLANNFKSWAKPDIKTTNELRLLDPQFKDLKSRGLTQMVEDHEIVARIEDPVQMAVDYVKEFTTQEVEPVWRLGWEVVSKEDGEWVRRRVIDVGIDPANKELFFVLDSNEYWSNTAGELID